MSFLVRLLRDLGGTNRQRRICLAAWSRLALRIVESLPFERRADLKERVQAMFLRWVSRWAADPRRQHSTVVLATLGGAAWKQ